MNAFTRTRLTDIARLVDEMRKDPRPETIHANTCSITFLMMPLKADARAMMDRRRADGGDLVLLDRAS